MARILWQNRRRAGCGERCFWKAENLWNDWFSGGRWFIFKLYEKLNLTQLYMDQYFRVGFWAKNWVRRCTRWYGIELRRLLFQSTILHSNFDNRTDKPKVHRISATYESSHSCIATCHHPCRFSGPNVSLLCWKSRYWHIQIYVYCMNRFWRLIC